MNSFATIDLGIDIYRGDVWIIWCPIENLKEAQTLYPESEGYRFGDRRRLPRDNPLQQEQAK